MPGEAGRTGTAQPGEGKTQGDLIHVYKFLVVNEFKSQSSISLSGDQWKDKRQRAQSEIKGIQLKHKKTSYCCGEKLWEQAALRDFGLSLLGDAQIKLADQELPFLQQLHLTEGKNFWVLNPVFHIPSL